jgi:hypothetical protein
MKKLFIASLLTLLIFANFHTVSASLLVVKPNGSLQINVLSAEKDITLSSPDHSNLEFNKVGNNSVSDASIVKLNKTNGKVNLQVYGTSGLDNLNVTDYKDNILEVEERPDSQKISISLDGDSFQIRNKGALAKTTFPITVDSKSAKVSVSTDTGDKILAVYPYDAAISVLRTKLLTTVDRTNIEIIVDNDQLEYKIPGERTINILDFYNYSIPILSFVSASTGAIIKVDAPGWLKLVNFLFA